MNEIEQFKGAIDMLCDTVRSVGEKLGVTQQGTDIRKVAKMHLAMFLMYLSASDGEIKPNEAKLISYWSDLQLTAQDVADVIRKNNIYSTEFESQPPVSLMIMVQMDNLIFKLHQEGRLNNLPEEDPAKTVINLYSTAGDIFLKVDGDMSPNEMSDLKIYLNMMENYANENSLRRKKSTSGFVKNSESVRAPLKHGVAAPKKS